MADSSGMSDANGSDKFGPVPKVRRPHSSQLPAAVYQSPPSPLPNPAASTTDQNSKRSTLTQTQSDTISAAKAVRTNIMPQRPRKKKKSSQKKFVYHIFP